MFSNNECILILVLVLVLILLVALLLILSRCLVAQTSVFGRKHHGDRDETSRGNDQSH